MNPTEYHELVLLVAGILGMSVATVIVIVFDLCANRERNVTSHDDR